DELRALPVKAEYQQFPLYDAEVLAARPGDSPGIWKVPSSGGRVIALYRTATLRMHLRAALPVAPELEFDVIPPDTTAGRHDEWMPAGARLPGWRITLSVRDSKIFETASRKQSAAYAWVAFLFIATMAVLALIGGQTLRRQMRVARLKTDLISAVSHELKTPLASMKLLVELLLDRPDQDPAKTREYLEMISRENDRLSRLIDNFLTFSRMERGYQRFDRVETTARTVVELAVQSLGERFESILTVDVAAGIPAFHADEDAVVTVLRNLLDNAYKYSGRHKLLRLRARWEADSVCFALEDNGIGIPAREQKKIFRRFYQVDRRLSRQTGGAGLGLSIVEFIVQAHGGTIQVNSRPGGGSTFTVCLPCPAEGGTA
ncbi:MAG: HAMP domain-containing sensor histidine kinase, partial [Acidobacteria bacterium]|nr:HAMP domain-containing sensor histidine kinase [Acidobacteriota bacterium]